MAQAASTDLARQAVTGIVSETASTEPVARIDPGSLVVSVNGTGNIAMSDGRGIESMIGRGREIMWREDRRVRGARRRSPGGGIGIGRLRERDDENDDTCDY
tara:strand:+ start:1160 stop:1465 length:306 start_codon:yes stop_codon:yes gene_type:complete